MLTQLIGAASTVRGILDGLDRSSSGVRDIASRIAGAGAEDPATFAEALDGAEGAVPTQEIDLEAEMVALAEEQIRFDAQARMLEKMYERIRLSVRG